MSNYWILAAVFLIGLLLGGSATLFSLCAVMLSSRISRQEEKDG